MFESVVMVPLLATLLFIEMYRADPRALLHKPTDESPFFVGIFHDPSEKDADATPEKKGKTKKSKKAKIKRQATTQLISNAESDAGVRG